MKIKNAIMILLIFLVFVTFINALSASDVNNTHALNDTNIDEIKVPENFNTLFNEIKTANNNLTLEKDYKFNKDTDYWYTDGIPLHGCLEIDGQGHTIDANGQSRIFLIGSSKIIIKNLTLINAFNSQKGGAVMATEWASNLIFDNCTFANNNVKLFGGAIYSAADDVQLINCTFYNNSAKYGGAGLFEIPANMFNCTFSFNTAENAGAVLNGAQVNPRFGNYVKYSGPKISLIEECIFYNNTGSRIGAMDCQSYTNIIGCNFTNNSAKGGCGALNMECGNLRYSVFINNSAAASTGAFGFFNLDNLEYCVFKYNKAQNGGAITAGAFNNIVGCIIENNTASISAGGVFVRFVPGNCKYIFKNNQIKNNIAKKGLSLYCGYDVVLLNNDISNNDIEIGNGVTVTFK